MKTADFDFEEYPGDAYSVTVSPIPLAVFEKVTVLFETAITEFTTQGTTAGIRTLVPEFIKVAKPVLNGKPLTAKLADGDPNLTFAIVRQWHTEVREVPLPLPRRSVAGGPSPAP